MKAGKFLTIIGVIALLMNGATGGVRSAERLAEILYLYNWDNYIAPRILEDFQREFGVRVIEDKFSSNEELLAKLQAGGGGYDVIVPSDYAVRIMIRKNLLAPLNQEILSNFNNLDARFRNPTYDPGLRYSVPYLWGTSGIGYRRKAVAMAGAPTGWEDLFSTSKLSRYKGRISMLNDMREVIGAALIYLGFSPNSTVSAELDQAKTVLLRQKALIAKYDSEAYEDSLAAGETVLAHGWSGEFFAAQKEKPDIGFIVPREGSFLFVDNLAVPAASKRRHTALRFIDYLLRADVAAANSSYLRYPTPNAAARALIDPKLDGANYELPAGIKLYSIEDIGDFGRLYEKVWTELKAH